MHYLSPVLLFGKTFQVPFDTRTIHRERKRLLAELELSGGDAIELNERSFSKNDLINYFEEIQQNQVAFYHLEVSKDHVLLQFLQDGSIDPGETFKEADSYNSSSFIRWLSPYFRSSFAILVANSFEQADAECMRAVLDNKMLMSSDDKEQSWLLIASILEKNIAYFKHYIGRHLKTSPEMMPITHVDSAPC